MWLAEINGLFGKVSRKMKNIKLMMATAVHEYFSLGSTTIAEQMRYIDYMSQCRKLREEFLMVCMDRQIFTSYPVGIKRGIELQAGGQLAGKVKMQIPGSAGPVCSSENITHITQHPSQRLFMSPRPPPIANSAAGDHLPWKSQFEEQEKGGEVVSSREREDNCDRQELVVVTFIFIYLFIYFLNQILFRCFSSVCRVKRS